MNYSTNYYDIDVDKLIDKSCCIDDCFYLKDLKQRKLFIDDDICQETIGEIVKHIMQFNKEDKGIKKEDRTPILLYITSNGGNVDDGFELIDIIKNSETPVYTINLGYQYSMAFLINLAGQWIYYLHKPF